MSPEGILRKQTHEEQEQQKGLFVSVESIGKKLEKYPKALRALFFVAALGVGSASQKAEAEDNVVTGGISQESRVQKEGSGVTGEAAHAGEANASAEQKIVTPRAGRNWVIPPEYREAPGSVSENVSIGRVTVDGKEITEDE